MITQVHMQMEVYVHIWSHSLWCNASTIWKLFYWWLCDYC